jgi:hypothetical protein
MFSKLSRAGSGPLPGPVAAIDPDTTPPIAAIKKTDTRQPYRPPGVFAFMNATKPLLFCCVQIGQIKNTLRACCIPS